MKKSEIKYLKSIRNILIIVCIVLAVYYAGAIVMPILLSGFLAIMFSPFQKNLEEFGLPKVLSILLPVIGGTIAVLAIIVGLSFESQEIISSLPQQNVEKVLDKSTKTIEDNVVSNGFGSSKSDLKKVIEVGIEKGKSFIVSTIPVLLSKVSNTVVFFFTCPIYMFFMLLYRRNLRGFYYESLNNSDKGKGQQILLEIEDAFGSYLKGMLIVISIIAGLTSLGLYLLGIEYALFLGVLSGLLSLVPFIGIVVSASIPIVLALITKDSLWYVAGVVVVFAVVQFIEGNIITPKIVGNKVDVNPLVVILGIVIFGSIGGIPAMIITIPLLGLIRIIASHKPTWKPLEKLLRA